MLVFLRVRDDKATASVCSVITVVTNRTGDMILKHNDDTNNVLEQLENTRDNLTIEFEGQKILLRNLNKDIWPKKGRNKALTKRDLISYLARVSPYLLPHLRDRPLTLSRFPNGINGKHFFQKHYRPVPKFVETVLLSSPDTPVREYLLCNNLATLLWLAQIADIELHTWYSRVKPGADFRSDAGDAGNPDFVTDYPDFIVFDIDPYIYSGRETAGDEPELNREAFHQTCQVALKLKETLDDLSFPSFVKTSGRTGLHVFAPVLRQFDFHKTHSVAETICRHLSRQHPHDITTDWAVEKRKGKIFLDYNQNVRGKTLASIYSPRPSLEATVSMPLHWDELDKAYPTDFTILTVPDRLDKTGDLWENILADKVDTRNKLTGILSESQENTP